MNKTVELHQWFKNGDHPNDHVGEPTVDVVKLCNLHPELLERDTPITAEDIPPEAYYYRIEGAVVKFFRLPSIQYPDFAGNKKHKICMYTWHNHGWIDDSTTDGQIVCPGDWIVTATNGEYSVLKNKSSEALMEERNK